MKNDNTLLKVGMFARYINTGTIGKIVKIDIQPDGEIFALLDSTNLYYNVSYLEFVNDKELLKKDIIKNIEKDIEEKIRIQEESLASFSAEHIDAPGGAG